MSKEIEWGVIHGEGEIVCMCDNCHSEETFPFEEGCFDFKEVSRELREYHGWIARQVNGQWKDFCTSSCYKEYLENSKR